MFRADVLFLLSVPKHLSLRRSHWDQTSRPIGVVAAATVVGAVVASQAPHGAAAAAAVVVVGPRHRDRHCDRGVIRRLLSLRPRGRFVESVASVEL